MSVVKKQKDIRTGSGTGFGTHQVVLLNDDHNTLEYVVLALMNVFSHDEYMSVRLAMEAHSRGRSIAQVEDEASAVKHSKELTQMGIGSKVEKI